VPYKHNDSHRHKFENAKYRVTNWSEYNDALRKRGDLTLTQGVNMGTTRKTITLTDQQDQWIKAQIAAGEYTNDSEYIRDLVRRDQEQNAKYRALKAAIQEGLDSGISNKTVRDVWEEAEARYRAKHG